MDTENTKTNKNILTEIYFGSATKRAKLAFIPSKVWQFEGKGIFCINDNFTAGNALSKIESVGLLGKEYEGVYLPCPPAHELLLMDYGYCFDEAKRHDKFILNPLIKVEGDEYLVEGYQSGKRSAIVPWEGKYYRLKGCGNLTQGFPLEPMQSYHPNAKEIRGCQFLHTALREQYMTWEITQILEKHDIIVGNIPAGIWKYPSDQEEYEKLGLKNVCPRVDKYCGVFETFAEKRLATHLLQGIEVFLHYLIDHHLSEKVTQETLLNLFPAERRLEEDPENPVTPLSWLGPFLDIPEDQTISQWTSNKIYPEEAFTNLVDLKAKAKQVTDEVGGFFQIKDIKETINGFISRHQLPVEYAEIMIELAKDILENGADVLGLLGLLYSRIGWECGTLKRIFQENDINWGYFADHDKNIYHCNAHPNNFVILPKNISRNLLGPLDFDLSFFRKDFINIDNYYEKYGEYNERLFDTFLNCERYALEQALSGDENMANFSYSLFKLENTKDTTKMIFGLLKTILRDTCVLYYRRAYDRYEDETMVAFDARNEGKLYSLINMALLITREIVV